MNISDYKICVIGLGYVGLPLARLFSTKFQTVGFDMNQVRVDALMSGHDATLEVSDDLLQDAIDNYGFKCTPVLTISGTAISMSWLYLLRWMKTTVQTFVLFGVRVRQWAR